MRLEARSLVIVAGGAAALALAQALALGLQLGAVAGDGPWPLRDVSETLYFRTSVARIALGVLVALAAGGSRSRLSRGAAALLVAAAVALGSLSAATSHAAARPGDRMVLLVLDAIHQGAGWVWVGGLVHLTAALVWWGRAKPAHDAMLARLLRRFSATALAAVALVVLSGAALSAMYIDSLAGWVGTAYGLMVSTKIVLLGLLLGLGALNFFAVRALTAGRDAATLRLRRFVTVEVGLGLTVLFAAASLTSQPPARDVQTDRATFAEVARRFTPRLPTFTSSRFEDMPVTDKFAPRNDADRQWSEVNHHVAGVIVLLMGVLGLAAQSGRAPWARHWPLLLLVLTAFMLVRNDPSAWPLGPLGFWESMREPSVLQHRLFIVLAGAFGLFEWLVRRGRIRAPVAALVFPLVGIVGGALLLTHSHASLNLKDEFLIEITHAPLGVLALVVGWARWLELRLSRAQTRLPARLWGIGMVAIGGLLVLYRES